MRGTAHHAVDQVTGMLSPPYRRPRRNGSGDRETWDMITTLVMPALPRRTRIEGIFLE